MDLRIAARMTAVLALCAAMTAAFMVLRGDGSRDASSPRSAHPGGEPAKVELARCRDIGMAAIADGACRRAWTENRRRFLRPSRLVAPYAAPSAGKDQSRLLPHQPFTLPGADDPLQPQKVVP
jgi:conjugative transfer region protein TrbK